MKAFQSIPLFLLLYFSFCLRSNQIPEKSLLNQDYYFTGNSVQILGRASLPTATAASGGYRTLDERREACRGEALLHSHSKWLSLTRENYADPAEWYLRLTLGARGEWSECIEKRSRVLSYFFDSFNSCRLTVLYSCLPHTY